MRVVVDILVAQRLGVKALGDELLQGVLDKDRIAPVAKASGQPPRQPEGPIGLAQEQHAAVAGECAAGKIGHDLARAEVLKKQRLVLTVCRRSSGGRQLHLAQ